MHWCEALKFRVNYVGASKCVNLLDYIMFCTKHVHNGMLCTKQDGNYRKTALYCYLGAVIIDSKDYLIWNQLCIPLCSMDLFRIFCREFKRENVFEFSNENCMEKLLEVLNSTSDEIACASIPELMLRHWPSHSHVLHVQSTTVQSKPMSFAPSKEVALKEEQRLETDYFLCCDFLFTGESFRASSCIQLVARCCQKNTKTISTW